MSEFLQSIFPLGGLWSILAAILLLIVAFIVSAIVRSLVVKLLNKVNAGRYLDKLGVKDNGSSISFVGKLVQCIVFLLFVPGILALLGLDTMSAPIIAMLDSIIGYIPNIAGAVILLVIGCFVAKLIRQLLVPVFARLKLDELQKKAGITVGEEGKISFVSSYIVYVLILIPIIIASLNVLGIRAISDPAISMLNRIFEFIPNIAVTLVILIIGCLIGKFAGQIVESMLSAAGLDAKISKLMPKQKFQFAHSVGVIVRVVIIVFFAVEAVSVLKLAVLSNIGQTVIAYLPRAISAIVIFLLCLVASSKATEAIIKVSSSAVYAMVAKTAIMVVGGFMILSQLGLATSLVNVAFVLILGALAVAFAIAFGCGGRDFAAKTLAKLKAPVEIKAPILNTEENIPENKDEDN